MNIDNLHPRTGRYIAEDNEIHNVVERVTGGHKNITTDPTNISGGTVLETIDFGGGGNGANAPSGSRSLDIEFVLKQNTTYLFRVTNNSGATENITLFVFWYEEGAA